MQLEALYSYSSKAFFHENDSEKAGIYKNVVTVARVIIELINCIWLCKMVVLFMLINVLFEMFYYTIEFLYSCMYTTDLY